MRSLRSWRHGNFIDLLFCGAWHADERRSGVAARRGAQANEGEESAGRVGWDARERDQVCVLPPTLPPLFGFHGVCPSRLHHLLYVEQLPFLQRIHILPKCATSATSRNHQEASYRIVTLKRDLQSLDGQGTPLKSRSLSSDGGRRRRINETSDGVFSRACCCSRGGGLHRVALGRCAGEIR